MSSAAGSNTLFVARNIPIPGHRENDIILQFADQLKAAGVGVEIAYPAEWMPVPSGLLRGIRRAVAALPNRFESHGHRVRVFRYLRLPGLQYSYALAGHFRGGRVEPTPDWIHAHYVLPDGIMARTLAHRLNRPYAVTVRQGDMRKWQQLHVRSPLVRSFDKVLRGASSVFTPSTTIAAELAERGIDATLLPHGMTLPSVERSPIEPSPDGLTVFAAASLLPLKQLDWLIDALPTVPEISRLTLAGDGPERNRLVDQVARQNLGDRVCFLGAVSRDEVLRQMSACDIYALPSVRETFGLSYLEAAACGCAVMACRHTGVHGCFEEDQEMVFCEPDRDDAIAVLARLCRDTALRQRVASGGRKRVETDYTWPRVIGRYLSTVTGMIAP